jgi:ABC-type spermidine/putrescine transport system permease subunit II
MILPSILEKVSYGMALVILFAQHRLPLSTFTIGSVDWIFAVLFIAAYVATKPDHAVAAHRS